MDQVQVNFKLKYITLIFGLIVTIVAVGVGVYKSLPIGNLLSLFAAGVALTALVYTAINSHFSSQVHLEQLRIKKLENSMIFIEYSSSPEMIRAVSVGMAFRNEVKGKNGKEITSIFSSEPEKKEAIIMIFNYFERLGIVVRSGAADEEALKEYYRGAIRRYWHSLSPWIKDLRAEYQDDNLMKEMEYLLERWN